MGRGLRSLILEGEEIVAPALFQAEAFNVFWKYVHAGLKSKQEATELISDTLDLVDFLVDLEGLSTEAFFEAVRVDRSVYDMYYLVLARRNDATLLTADRKLMELADELGVSCAQVVAL